MLFNSPIYIFLFLPLVVFTYFALNRSGNFIAAKVWLIVASLFFYGYWNPIYLLLITSSICINYAVGAYLSKKGNKQQSLASLPTRKRMLIFGILFNLFLLGYFKYADFFIENVNAISDLGYDPLNLILPLAISFFTFQQIAYIVDCYREEVHEYSFLNYALFVSFFPQLIAGPIVHHKQMMPQFMLQENSHLNWSNVGIGVYIFFMGLFKKVVIADTFSVWANAGFSSPVTLSFLDAWGTTLSYTFQLYYDFSGYTDMAIGAALIFNIKLPINFNSPYKALSIRDFWQRWHITLSNWLRDYVYIPFGGNKRDSFRTYQNLMFTFIIGGLWHGAGWTFVVWGGLHGFALVVHRIWCLTRIQLPIMISWLLTFLFVHTAWVFFRAESITSAWDMLKAMAGVNGIVFSVEFSEFLKYLSPIELPLLPVAGEKLLFGMPTLEAIVVFGVAAVSMPNSIQIIKYIPGAVKLAFKPTMAFAILLVLMACTSFMTFVGDTSPSEFLYYNF